MGLGKATYIISKLRKSKEYRQWRNKVLERDKYKCVVCGKKDDLEVDHIKPLALYPALSLDINNGRVLCKECHKKTDTYGSLSTFKGIGIHPILSGNFLYKIKLLPTYIEFNGQKAGFLIQYRPHRDEKNWIAGYKFARINFTVKGKDIEDAIDKIFLLLRETSNYKYNEEDKRKKYGIK